MGRLQNTFLLYTIILIEGYIVLSTELIAMRQTIAYVGSGTDTVSIIIAAVLMPLAIGYYSGGRYRQRRIFGTYLTLRNKLIFNIMLAGIILLPGLSYITIQFFFESLANIGIEYRHIQISLYCITFIVFPVYLLGQTIPLVSNYFSKKRLSAVTGHMLFFSTIGSFLGAVFSTLILMGNIGVNNTVSLNFALLACLIILLSKTKTSQTVMWALLLAFCGMLLNANFIMAMENIVKSNTYHDLIVYENPETTDRHLIINGNTSSKYNNFGEKYPYIEFAERVSILSLPETSLPIDILIVGAGGFTFGHQDTKNNYVYVDIDADLDDIAEKYILKEKIKPNKIFEAVDVRAYLRAHPDKKFDLTYLDAYLGGMTIPESLITVEFFKEIKNALKTDGVVIGNFIGSPNMTDKFSRSLDQTFRTVFPFTSRHVIRERYSLWDNRDTILVNFAYIYKHTKPEITPSTYTDDLNKVFKEKPGKYQPPG